MYLHPTSNSLFSVEVVFTTKYMSVYQQIDPSSLKETAQQNSCIDTK